MSYKIKTYHQVLKNADNNESLAFKNIYQNYWEKLFHYSFKILQNQTACEDIIQEIFFALWKNTHKEEIQNISGYLFQSLRFQIYKYYRDKKTPTLDIEKFNNIIRINNIENLLNYQDLKSEILKHIEILPTRCKEIFYLSRFKQLSHKEIADKLNISIRTVKNQISIVLKHLRKHVNITSWFWIFFLFSNT